jgi:hypothetical protein
MQICWPGRAIALPAATFALPAATFALPAALLAGIGLYGDPAPTPQEFLKANP